MRKHPEHDAELKSSAEQDLPDAWHRARELRERIAERRRGKPLASSVPYLRELRDDRTPEL